MQYMAQMQGRGDGLNLHQEVMVGLVSWLHLFLIFIIPILAMRQFTEEKKMRTFDLLLTMPISATEIVVGKFLSTFLTVIFLVGICLIYPLAISRVAEIEWNVLLSSFLGIILLGGIYVAIGIFASSLTDSMIAAFGLSFVLSLSLWFVSWGAMAVEDSQLTVIINHMAVANHFQEMIRGNVQLSGIIFCLSLIFLFCFLTQRVVESARWR